MSLKDEYHAYILDGKKVSKSFAFNVLYTVPELSEITTEFIKRNPEKARNKIIAFRVGNI